MRTGIFKLISRCALACSLNETKQKKPKLIFLQLVANNNNLIFLLDFYTWDSVKGINLDMIFLLVDFMLMFLILVGLETGYIQKYWQEYVKGCGCFRNSEEFVENM